MKIRTIRKSEGDDLNICGQAAATASLRLVCGGVQFGSFWLVYGSSDDVRGMGAGGDVVSSAHT